MAARMDWALDHAAKGWKVFPVTPNAKAPPLVKWKEEATTDPVTIRMWWKEWPDANIGIACGRESGLIVLDLDDDDASDAIEEKFGVLPRTLWCQTPNGYHAYFRPLGEVGNTIGSFLEHVDTRGEGGYVLAPGSEIDGCTYEWYTPDDLPLAAAPAWLEKPPSIEVTTSSTSRLAVDLTVEKVLADRVMAVRNAIDGSRNKELNDAAVVLGHYIPHRIARERVESELLDAARRAGLAEREARATITSGIDAGIKQPRSPKGRSNGWESNAQTAHRLAVGSLFIRRLEDVPEEKVNFLWGSRIPLGKLTLLAGYAKQGKSFLTLALAAHVTAGQPLPDCGGNELRGEVLFCSYEDGTADTIKPRAGRLGADLTKFHVVEGVEIEGHTRPFGPHDADQLAAHLRMNPNIKLVVIDPLGSFAGANANMNSENEIRAVLQTLTEAAKESGAAFLVVAHRKKGESGVDPLHGISGSQSISALARSVLFAGEAQEEGLSAVVHAACNVGPLSQTIAYKIDEGTLHWGKTIDADIANLLPRRGRKADKRHEAEGWLRQLLEDAPINAKEAKRLGEEQGYSESTLQRGLNAIGGTSRPIDAQRSGYVWELPEQAKAIAA
jgi:Bifunctional DNA primase/polymerase, N-terminal/AAA domain